MPQKNQKRFLVFVVVTVDSDGRCLLPVIGLPQLSDFGAAKIFSSIIFGAIGFAAFMYGKKNSFMRPMVIGIVLMAYPYFIEGTFLLYLVGIVLCAALYFWRD